MAVPARLGAQINKEYFFGKGTGDLIERKYYSAIESFNLLLKVDTGMYDAYYLRAIAKHNLGDTWGALADFNHAITLNPVFTYAYFYRSVVRNSMGHHAEALKDLDEAATLRPELSAIYYSRGVSYFYLQQFDLALDNYNTFLRNNPKAGDGYLNRGTCYLFLKDTTAALQDYERAIAINSFDPDGFSRRGRVYAMQEKYPLALQDFDKAIAIDSNSSLNYYFRAITLYNTKNIAAALKDLDKVLSIDPYNALIYYNRALMHAQIGDYDKALKDYNKASEINPSNVLIYYNRAAVLMEVGKVRDAIKDYSKAIELYPDFANAYLNRSHAKRKNNDWQGARADYDIAQKKITEHQKKMQHDEGSSFADTSRQYNNLVAFDADFGNKEFSSDLLQYQRADITLQPLYHIAIGAVVPAEKDYNKIYFNEALEQWKRQHTRWQIGVLQSTPTRTPAERKQWEQSANALSDSLACQNGMGYFAKASLLSEQNMYNASLNFYKQAIAGEPQNPFYHFAYSVAQSQMIDFVSNIDHQQTTTIVVENHSTSTLQSNHQTVSRTYDYSEAIEELNKTIALLPSFAYAYYNRANLKCHSNQMPEAIEDYNAAIARYPYFADAYYNRGLIQIYMHDTNKGCLDMSKAGELGAKAAYNVIKRYCKTQ
ncbi:hypothetical protein AGMMS4956_06920 [Bacteroidia bacterium]|nr:hypothetical protein AGMMS4956_06920 [Bacteroidia bacterium]